MIYKYEFSLRFTIKHCQRTLSWQYQKVKIQKIKKRTIKFRFHLFCLNRWLTPYIDIDYGYLCSSLHRYWLLLPLIILITQILTLVTSDFLTQLLSLLTSGHLTFTDVDFGNLLSSYTAIEFVDLWSQYLHIYWLW